MKKWWRLVGCLVLTGTFMLCACAGKQDPQRNPENTGSGGGATGGGGTNSGQGGGK